MPAAYRRSDVVERVQVVVHIKFLCNSEPRIVGRRVAQPIGAILGKKMQQKSAPTFGKLSLVPLRQVFSTTNERRFDPALVLELAETFFQCPVKQRTASPEIVEAGHVYWLAVAARSPHRSNVPRGACWHVEY